MFSLFLKKSWDNYQFPSDNKSFKRENRLTQSIAESRDTHRAGKSGKGTHFLTRLMNSKLQYHFFQCIFKLNRADEILNIIIKIRN